MMKKIIILSASMLFFAMTSTFAQVVVRVKPQRPLITVAKPQKTYKNKLWVQGQWKWDPIAHKYQWVKARWIKKRKAYKWVDGTWRKVPSGWKYTPGHWAKT